MSDPTCELCGGVDRSTWGWVRSCTCEECGAKHLLCLYCCESGDSDGALPLQDVPQKLCPDRLRVARALMGNE